MTYAEIYQEICNLCFPGTNVPVNMPLSIRRQIRQAQRMLNRDYNFWFTIYLGTIPTVAGQQAYALPSDYKEIEKGYFMIDGQNYGTPPLTQLDITDHIDRGFHQSHYETEYPDSFRIDGSNLYFYPVPKEVRDFKILYWRFLQLVPEDETLFNAFAEDAFGLYCAEPIIYYVAHKIKLSQDEWQSASMYKQLFYETLEGAMNEDKSRRAIPETVVPV